MKKLYFLSFLVTLSFSVNAQLLNEFEPNPVGTDPTNVSFELSGTPSAAFSGWIVSIESDPGTQGLVDRATSVSGTFDANGLLVVTVPDLENPSFTVVLCSDFTGTVGTTDIDTDDDGAADDFSSLGTVYDAIGIPDNTGDETYLYGTDVGGADFVYSGDEPQLVFRDGGSEVWTAVNDPEGTDVYDIAGLAIPISNYDIDPSANAPTYTFGSVNPTNNLLSTDSFSEDRFNVYPNPTSIGFVNIKSASNELLNVAVFNVLGKQVLKQTVNNSRLNVSSLNSGIYVMRISQDNSTSTKKLVIR